MGELGGYGATIIATLWTETAIALVFVSMRLWTRIRINHIVGWDDYLIALSSIMLIPYASAVTFAALHGLGRHSDELALNQFIEATQAVMIGQTFGLIGVATSKASVAAFILRISITNWHKWLLYFVILSVSITCFLCALFDFIRCTPIKSVWNPLIPGHCWIPVEGFTTLSVVVGAISATADFVLAILPWCILWNLKMRQKEKILIACSMSLGLFAGVCGVIRTCTVDTIASGTDYSYETVRLIMWSSTELTVTILCATLPTLRPLYKQTLGGSSSFKERYRNDKLGDIPSHGKNTMPVSLNTTKVKSSITIGSRSTDNRSDKCMLGGRADRSIVCTDVVDVVNVAFEERRETYTSGKGSSPSNRSVQIWDGQVWELV